MNPLIQLKKATPLFLAVLVLVCLTLSPRAQAVSPAPDGGYPGFNTAEGDGALNSLTTGINNTANGESALFTNTIGVNNTANGFQALLSNTTGSDNTASGGNALFTNTTGVNNTANGDSALFHNTTGHNNIGLGAGGGANLTTGNNNIDIGNVGGAGEANTIRIGRVGTETKTFIAGIHGATASGGAAVFVNSSGQLGTAPSSKRFKDEIKPMDKVSEVILALKPVTFYYKKEIDPKGVPQFGLVAEDVENVNPDLVARDGDGKVYTVRYDAVNVMLLNEFLKEHRKVEEQQATIGRLETIAAKQEATITELKSTVAQQQKGLQTVTARLEQQAAQIQKVSAQLEASKPAPQMALNNP
jgi:uncharacterized coiled-coil protein SlyX